MHSIARKIPRRTGSCCTYLFAVMTGSTFQTNTADDGDDDAQCQQDDDGYEQTEVRVPDRSFLRRHRSLADTFSLWRERLNDDWVILRHTHLPFDTPITNIKLCKSNTAAKSLSLSSHRSHDTRDKIRNRTVLASINGLVHSSVCQFSVAVTRSGWWT